MIAGQPYIFVQDRGWNLVGVPQPSKEKGPLWVTLMSCATIREWGTNMGLGQLAQEGPREGTKLDREPDGVEINLDYCLRIIPCDIFSWEEWISESGSMKRKR